MAWGLGLRNLKSQQNMRSAALALHKPSKMRFCSLPKASVFKTCGVGVQGFRV